MMHNNLIDNSSEALSMKTYIKRCIQTEEINKIRIATGYWDIPGMAVVVDELADFLEKENTSMELLIGKDPYVYASLLKNPKYKTTKYPEDFIRTDLHKLKVKEEYKRVVELLIRHCGSGKLQIRIYSKNSEGQEEFLHSKCYIFSSKDFSFGIIGSSNFTEKGLIGNSELNYLETDPSRVTARPGPGSLSKGHICWFEEKWELAENWTQEFLEQILKGSPIYIDIKKEKEAPFTPYELYIKALQLQFGDILDAHTSRQLETYLPSNIHKLNYQIDAVKRCISIMHEHGGFMLADVVGLGKTIVGTLIIKHFLSNPDDEGRERKVLVVTPPAIQSGWKKTIALFDKETKEKMLPLVDFITTGSIGNITEDDDGADADDDSRDTGEFSDSIQEKNYGLIIIDESHKFRNSGTLMYQALDNLIQQIGANTGVFPFIGLLSATPQNNRPNDLKNQIYLFERNHNDSTLKKAESGNIEKFFTNVSREYDTLIRNGDDIPTEERQARLKAVSQQLRDCILCDILERRTRTDVAEYYETDMKNQGLVFPQIIGPNNLEYKMDEELAQLFYDTMSIIAPTNEEKLQTNEYLRYFRYRAIEYFVDPANRRKHAGRGNRGVSDVSDQLARIIQMLLVKRLESSFAAFKRSLSNLRRYTENMIRMWENNTIFVCPQIDINKELDLETKTKKYGKKITFNDCVNDIRAKIDALTRQGKNTKVQNAEYQREDFREEYIFQLKEDLRLISNLCDRWSGETADPKFDAFKENLRPELFNPSKNTSGKLVIFSEAIDTVHSLERAVKAKGFKVLAITAANRDENEHVIEENFDANYEGEWRDDYDVIITTEVLAEGINLHRANVILNYDTPWNATRLMQRIGRVNRIGSRAPYIYVYNFMPSAEGDAQIRLVRKAYTKLQSFHVLFGEDSKIFSEDETVMHYDLNQAVNGEESPFQKYIFELKQYKESHPERYQQIAQTEDAWQIAQDASGTAYFIIKAPKSARLAIQLCQETDGQRSAHIISPIDLLDSIRTNKDALPCPLPDNWEQLSNQAIRAYNQYFVRINKSRAGDKRTQALEVIVHLYKNPNTSELSKDLLKNARVLADRGNYDIISKMIAIGEELKENDARLFTLSQQDIDEILTREIGKLVAQVERRQGTAHIILGTIK